MSDQQTKLPGAVGRFFFSPTDPTTLGFMRIMTGLLLLYVHAAYSLDLQALVGPHGWWDHQAANQQRRDAPYISTPLGWRDFKPTIRVDDVPHRRNATLEFFRSLPSDLGERRAKLRYLERIFAGSPRDVNDGLYLANSAAKTIDPATQDARVRAALALDKIPESGTPVFIPEFIRKLPTPESRIAVWDEVLTFIAALPGDSEKQEFVLTWFSNYPHHERQQLYKFLVGDWRVDGKDMSLPADMRERDEFIEHMSRWGSDTRQADKKGTAIFSHWFHITDRTTMALVHAAALVVFFLFTIGLWTRVTSVMTWAISIAYIQRAQLSLFGQDTMQTILVTYLMIGPSGAALSVDAIRARYRAAKALMGSGSRSIAWAANTLNGPQPHWLANFAIRLVQINFCLIYLSSGISKLKGSTWWEHSAPWLVLVNPEFGLIRYDAYSWLMRQLVEYRPVISLIAGLVSVFTLVMEIGLPILVWTRLRPLMVIGAVMLHLGIAIIMGLSVFSMYMFTLLLCYFPAKLIRDRVACTPGAGKKMTLHYDSRNASAVRKAGIIRALDVAGQITYVDDAAKGPQSATVRLTDPDGKNVSGQELYHTALRELVLVKPIRFLGYVPGVWGVVNAIFGR